VAEHLLPHVCALVSASEAALLARRHRGARYPIWVDEEGTDLWRGGPKSDDAPDRRITVRTTAGHALAGRQISPYTPYFGSEELHQLEQLASMVGLAIERCEMAEQMAFQPHTTG